ncbi:cytosolic protein [Rossellomorea sp. BNER]|jgi:hypothetical protein|uniref:cytosolic protein n=1 Tax=Rossellomorea sp. BNER TaxID=2962031 RepID=UPI003AF213D9|nr:cytosolic protein [Rossellomorea sp. BNER]
MGVVQSLLRRFNTECETSDQPADEELKTHYYKSAFDKVYRSVLDLFLTEQFKVISDSKERGEVTIQKIGRPPLFIVVTIITVRPFETAVDFKISTDGKKLSGTYPLLKQEALSYYEKLDGQLIRK